MKLRPCRILVIIWILSMLVIPIQNVESQQLFDTYITTWTKYNYLNLTDIEIKHPANGSLVAEGQRLSILVIPFDADTLGYSVEIYQSGVMLYNCGDETAYDIIVFCDNPVNSVVTVTFKIHDETILKLEYLALLDSPSLDRDYTEEWLKYQEEKEKSGRDMMEVRDKAMSDVNLVATTGAWAFLFVGLATAIVLTVQIISPWNAFTGLVFFGTGMYTLDRLNSIEQKFLSLSIASPDDVMIYHANQQILLIWLLIAIGFYIFVYWGVGKRLDVIEWEIYEIPNRVITRSRAVLGHRGGKHYYRWQTSDRAVRRLLLKEDYECNFEGDPSKRYAFRIMKADTRNVGTGRNLRMIKKHLTDITNRQPDPEEIKRQDILSFNEIRRQIARIKGKIKLPGKNPTKPKTDKERKDYLIWKTVQYKDTSPIVVLDKPPHPYAVYDEQVAKTIEEKMAKLQEARDPTVVDKLKKDLKHLRKAQKRPVTFKIDLSVSNPDVCGVEHYMSRAKIFGEMSDYIKDLKDENHDLKIENKVKALKYGEEYLDKMERGVREHVEEMRARQAVRKAHVEV